MWTPEEPLSVAVSQIPAAVYAAGAVAVAVVSSAVEPAIGEVVLQEYGPIGFAVYVLYRRIDKMEDRLDTKAERGRERDRRISELEAYHD